jgi:hypothetical protein
MSPPLCGNRSYLARFMPTNDLLRHAATSLCVVHSSVGVDASGNLPLVMSTDCERRGVAVPFQLSNTSLLQNMMNRQFCMQAAGGYARHGVNAVMAPNCLPILTLQFEVQILDFPAPTPSPVPSPEPSPVPSPVPSPAVSCTTCITFTNYFTNLTTNVPPTLETCNQLAVEASTNSFLTQLADPYPMVFTCTSPPPPGPDANNEMKFEVSAGARRPWRRGGRECVTACGGNT